LVKGLETKTPLKALVFCGTQLPKTYLKLFKTFLKPVFPVDDFQKN